MKCALLAVAAAACRDATARATGDDVREPTELGTASVAQRALSARRVSAAFERSGTADIDLRAERVCDLLQREPARRKAACCESSLASNAFDDCVRRLSRALTAHSVAIDEAALEACTLASETHFAGCDWITPSQPLPPAECRSLISGKLEAGAVCRSSLECAAPLHCKGTTPSEPGRCEPPEPAGAPCHATSDALAAALMIIDIDTSHPSCAGSCSSVSGRCEPPGARAESTPTRKSGSVAAGEACETDFDCAEGGCSGEPKHCGMKCAISFARDSKQSQPALILPRRSSTRAVD